MPVRFRSVVPYTMPGVLVLIGWWWYTSRKKAHLNSQKSTEVSPTPVSCKDSHLEGSNGLLYEEESPVVPNLNNQNTVNEIISPTRLQDTEAISLLKQKRDYVPFCGRIVLEEVDTLSNLISPTFGNKDLAEESMKPLIDPETNSTPAFIGKLEKCPAKELDLLPEDSVPEVALPSNASKDTRSSTIAIHLSNAERPEPEGEVATHHNTVNSQEEIICIFTSAKTHRAMTSDEDSPENPLPLHKRILTSTPTILSSKAQGTTTSLVTSVDMHFKRNTQELNDLELLAAGLITEVLSAAAQEVLGVTSCEVRSNNEPNNRSSALASGTRCSPDSTRSSLDDSLSQGDHANIKAGEKFEGVPKDGSLTPEWANVETRIQKMNIVQNEAWQTPSYQGNPVLFTKCRGDEAATLAEDSACSTCHSEEGISCEDLQSCMLENPADVFKVTDLSAKEAKHPQSVVETITKESEENSDAVCDVKKVNGDGLRNEAHGTCEVDTDQSGGSDVNSMDSMDSGCTMGVCENQGNSAASSTSELIIWEIEVPKVS
ncbi:hypothetical protein ILYODFUR_018987 [Ilyodon furcidens]|uniref:Uncharacterized protein n=1 Tax=Ilyodon furcidens TaxID=33524 RepID=A0ABV0TZJ6_9TELE